MPSPETVDSVLKLIGKNAANYRYFFEKLDSPEWLSPLANRGRFKTPPKKIEVEGGTSFPPWPESQYLARMAKNPAAQAEVLRIVLEMEETDNISVHADLLAIALALSGPDAARLVKRAFVWVQSPFPSLVADKISDLIVHLASGGQTKAAFQLANSVFAIVPSASEGAHHKKSVSPELSTWLDDWHYAKALKNAVPALVNADPIRTIKFLCFLLSRAIELSQGGKGDHEDYSYIWHKAIEKDERSPRLRSSIVSALRDALEQAVQRDPSVLTNTLDVLERYDWPVFERLKLHLLRVYADGAMDQIRAVVPALIDFPKSVEHEAGFLLRSVFARLPSEVQEDVLRRIDAGPEEPGVVRWLEYIGVQPTAEKIRQFGTHWRAERFALIADHLPETWRSRVQDVLTRAGDIRPVDQVEHGGAWLGPSSPKTAEELSQLGPSGVIDFLHSWNPKPGLREPTAEGLGRVLQKVIAKDPERYVERAGELRDLDPTFIRSFFRGLETALKESRGFTWKPVLALAQYVVEQPREIPGRNKEFLEADPDWQWTRGAIADLLPLGLQPDSSAIGHERRDAVWNILEPLTRDPDPTPEYEAKYGGQNMDPSTMALNTVRGKAFATLVSYAAWLGRYEAGLDPARPMSFEVMPEVRDVLNEHLDVDRDPALTIRAVYGQYFPWLQHFDHEWAQTAVDRIFPLDEKNAVYLRSAWDAYLMFNPAYGTLLQLLRAQYARAVSHVDEWDDEKRLPYSPAEHLAEHLLTYYWHGEIAIDDELLIDFFRLAADAVRGHAIEFVGHFLEEASEELEPTILTRLREFWEWRIQTARDSGNWAEHQSELAQFGRWFSSRKFDGAWSLDQLEAILDATQQVEPDFEVIRTLALIAVRFPLQCVRCAARIAQGSRHGWSIDSNREQFEVIIKTALSSDDVEAKAVAERLIQYLVGRGHFQYRSMLS